MNWVYQLASRRRITRSGFGSASVGPPVQLVTLEKYCLRPSGQFTILTFGVEIELVGKCTTGHCSGLSFTEKCISATLFISTLRLLLRAQCVSSPTINACQSSQSVTLFCITLCYIRIYVNRPMSNTLVILLMKPTTYLAPLIFGLTSWLYFIYFRIFTTRCTIVQSAVLRLHVVWLSVCLSLCNVGGSGSHRLEIL